MARDYLVGEPITPSIINQITPDDGEIIVGGPDAPIRMAVSDFANAYVPDEVIVSETEPVGVPDGTIWVQPFGTPSGVVDLDAVAEAAVAASPTIATHTTAIARVETQRIDLRTIAGAVADSPTTDNISAINAAITQATTDGVGEVFIPDGVWYVKPSSTSWIKLASNLTLTLAAKATLMVQDDTGNYPCLLSGNTHSTLVENVTIRGGTIDQNAAGNTTANIAIGNANTHQNIVRLYNYRNVWLDHVTLHSCGVNTVTLNDGDGEGALMDGVEVTWQQGATTTPNYDNTVFYIQGKRGHTVVGCRGYADVGQRAGAFIEVHGSSLMVDNNEADGFFALCYPTSETSALATQPLSNIFVTRNRAYRANYGIGAWSFAGYTIRGLKILDNSLHIAQVQHDQTIWYGISLYENVAITGTYEDVEISRNLIVCETGDSRTTTAGGAALNFNISAGIVAAPYGNVTGLRIDDNTVRNSPTYGYKIGRFNDAAQTIKDVRMGRNTAVDCGRNVNATAATRTALALMGTLVNVDVDRTIIHDSGASALNGMYATQLSAGLASGTNVKVRNTAISSVTGTLLTTIDRAKVGDDYQYITVTFPSIAAGAIGTQTTTITVKGAKTTDVVTAQPLGNLQAGLIPVYARCSSADTITIGLYNATAGALVPSAVNWAVRVHGGQVA
jgi:hypothetical protein